jgi:hypothetical protein
MSSPLQFGSVHLPKCTTSANTFVTKRKKQELGQKKRDWLYGLGDNWIYGFVVCGLKPFLQSYGYRLGYSDSKTVSYCSAWAFAHVQAKQKSPSASVQCIQRYHAGGEAEFDWFLHTISYDDWHELIQEWNASEFLDTSDAGFAQQTDLPFFVWNLIDLSSSPMHNKFLQTMYEENPEDDEFGIYQVIDESSAYGGDRRTL